MTGVPSSGMEYEDFSSPGLDKSVASSLGVVVSVSVGAGSGGAFFDSAPIVLMSVREATMRIEPK